MIVCHCFRVCDREIRSCVREGAASVLEVGHACAAGAGCGGCRPEIASILDSERGLSHAKGAFQRLPVLQETG
jgi:bacterioferritin-associated ferredoxin